MTTRAPTPNGLVIGLRYVLSSGGTIFVGIAALPLSVVVHLALRAGGVPAGTALRVNVLGVLALWAGLGAFLYKKRLDVQRDLRNLG